MKPYIMYTAICICDRMMANTNKSTFDESVDSHKTTCPEWGTK
jgi:hypothetical protein